MQYPRLASACEDIFLTKMYNKTGVIISFSDHFTPIFGVKLAIFGQKETKNGILTKFNLQKSRFLPKINNKTGEKLHQYIVTIPF